MALKTCPHCGEKYSDTYRDCPFCEEEEALRQGDRIRRSSGRGGRRVAGRSSQPNLISPILVVLILVMAALLIYLLFGDKIADRFFSRSEEDLPGTEEVLPEDEPEEAPEETPEEPGGVMPEDPELSEPEGGESGRTGMDYEQAAALPAGLTLSSTDFSLFTVGETATLTVSGGSGSYRWYSEDDGVASVDQTGKVTAISRGDIHVVVTDGSKQATCIVRVKVAAASSSASSASSSSSSAGSSAGTGKLNTTDFTRSVSEGSYQLTVSGVTASITWTSSNPAVATVSSTGIVTPVGPGTATVKASWNGQSLECIVRVPG